MTGLSNVSFGEDKFGKGQSMEQFVRARLKGMKLLDQYEAACAMRRLAWRTTETQRRWVETVLRFPASGQTDGIVSRRRMSWKCKRFFPAPELATGFELPIVRWRKKLPQITWSIRLSHWSI
jgi:hypothetical protein